MTQTTDSEVVVTPEALGAAGCISYWRLSGPVLLATLRDAWAAEGLDPKDLPAAPDAETALGRAVREQQAKRRLVRPLAKRGAWVIKDEQVDAAAADTTYRTIAHVAFNDGFTDIQRGADAELNEYIEVRDAIENAYRRHAAELQPEDISGWLVKRASVSKATKLRDTGGVYFVPRDAMDFWRAAVRAVEAATTKNHRVFKIPAMKNDEAVEAILDAVMAEAAHEAAALEAELSAEGDDALGARALNTRAKNCVALLDKVAHYEGLLDVRMDTIRERLADLQASVAAAALAAGVTTGDRAAA